MNYSNFNSFDNADNSVITKNLSNDLGIDPSRLGGFLAAQFVDDWKPENSVIWNVNKIADKLRAKKKAGEKLTFIEGLVVNASDFASQQIDKVKNEEINDFIKNNWWKITIGLVALVVVIKK